MQKQMFFISPNLNIEMKIIHLNRASWTQSKVKGAIFH